MTNEVTFSNSVKVADNAKFKKVFELLNLETYISRDTGGICVYSSDSSINVEECHVIVKRGTDIVVDVLNSYETFADKDITDEETFIKEHDTISLIHFIQEQLLPSQIFILTSVWHDKCEDGGASTDIISKNRVEYINHNQRIDEIVEEMESEI